MLRSERYGAGRETSRYISPLCRDLPDRRLAASELGRPAPVAPECPCLGWGVPPEFAGFTRFGAAESGWRLTNSLPKPRRVGARDEEMPRCRILRAIVRCKCVMPGRPSAEVRDEAVVRSRTADDRSGVSSTIRIERKSGRRGGKRDSWVATTDEPVRTVLSRANARANVAAADDRSRVRFGNHFWHPYGASFCEQIHQPRLAIG